MGDTDAESYTMADHDAQLATLISMGYDAVKAEHALKANDGNIEYALKYLVAGGKSVRNRDESCLSPDSLASSKQEEGKKGKSHDRHSHKKGGKKNQHDSHSEKSKHHTRARHHHQPDLDDDALTHLDDGAIGKSRGKKAGLLVTDGRNITSNENVASNESVEPPVAKTQKEPSSLPGAEAGPTADQETQLPKLMLDSSLPCRNAAGPNDYNNEHKNGSRHHSHSKRTRHCGHTKRPGHGMHEPGRHDDATAKHTDSRKTSSVVAVSDAPASLPNKAEREYNQLDLVDDASANAHVNDTCMQVPSAEPERELSNHFQRVFPGAYREGGEEGCDVETDTLVGDDSLSARQMQRDQDPDLPYMAVARVVSEPVLVYSEPSGWWSKRRNRFIIFGVGLLVVAGLVAGIVASQARTSTTDSSTPNEEDSAPTQSPIPTFCYSSLSSLDEVERNVTNINVIRTYVLCANTTFFTGFLTQNGDILGGDKPPTLRRKMRILCGYEGRSSDNCTISRGSFGLTSIPNNFDPPTFNNDVVIQGVTFENAAEYGVLIGLAGGFQFIDCIFVVSLSASSHNFVRVKTIIVA